MTGSFINSAHDIQAFRASTIVGVVLLGFALGGFLDGILLHQVLQWHHFLSLAQGEQYRDIRVQIFADGLFHVAVYVITGFALWLVWRGGAAGQGDRLLLGWAALGFSIWQFSDVVIFHWIIGIHRIRVDVENPLLWDLGWLMVFAVPSLFLAVWLLRKEGGPGMKSRPGFARPTLTLVALFAILLSALAPSSRSTVVVFRPSVTPSEAFAAAASINARILWSDSRGGALALDVPETENPWKLYWRGAIFVSAGAFTAPCAALLRT